MFEKGFFFKAPSQTEIVWAGILVAALFAGAILIEILRRRRERKLRIEAEWREVHEILDERQLSREERRLLEDLIHRRARRLPLRTVTVRQQFDKCVALEIPEGPLLADNEALERHGAMLRDIRIRLGLDYVPFGQRIHSTRELVRGQRIWAAPAGEGQRDWVRLIVASVDEAFFRLSPPPKAVLPPLKEGEAIQCRLWRDQDARYAFNARIVRIENSPPAWLIRHTAELDRLQARAHYRVHFEQSAAFAVLNAPLSGDMSDVHERQAVTRTRGRFTSLSGGGFAAVLSQALPKQVLLRALIELPTSGKPIQVVGQPVDLTPMGGDHYLVRAAFVGMSEEARDRIAQFVAQAQVAHGREDEDEPKE